MQLPRVSAASSGYAYGSARGFVATGQNVCPLFCALILLHCVDRTGRCRAAYYTDGQFVGIAVGVMDKYYLYVNAFVFFTSLIAIAMVRANVVLPHRVQRLFTLVFVDIIAGSISEFLTVWFDGAGAFVRPIMCIAQALDYACALFAPIAVSAAFINEKSKYVRIAFIVAGVHATVQLALSFSGLVFVVDDNAVFSRGPLYPLYILRCVSVISPGLSLLLLLLQSS